MSIVIDNIIVIVIHNIKLLIYVFLQEIVILNEFPDIRNLRDAWNILQFQRVQYTTSIFKTVETRCIKFGYSVWNSVMVMIIGNFKSAVINCMFPSNANLIVIIISAEIIASVNFL